MLAFVLALAASICYGSGDFLGGLSSRRASIWVVIVGSQIVGLAAAATVTFAAGHDWPGLAVVWPVLAGGLVSVLGLFSYYKALAIGTMSVVSPISATSAIIPFVVGIALGERPAPVQLAGAGLAVVGVVLAAIEPARDETIGVAALPGAPAVEPDKGAELFAGVAQGEAPKTPLPARGRRAAAPGARPSRRDEHLAVVLALVSALCIGLVVISYNATARHDPLWAMLGSRFTSAVAFCLLFALVRPPVRLARSAVLTIAAVGLLGIAANGFLAVAISQDYLSLVAVLASLYPVVTILLAYVVLGERMARHQIAGVLATLAGIVLIAA